MRRYWINTENNARVMVSFTNSLLQDLDPRFRLLVKLKECNWFEYYLYKYTLINVKAEDKFKWLKSFIKIKKEYFIQAIQGKH